jgi:hypothetical protein
MPNTYNGNTHVVNANYNHGENNDIDGENNLVSGSDATLNVNPLSNI